MGTLAPLFRASSTFYLYPTPLAFLMHHPNSQGSSVLIMIQQSTPNRPEGVDTLCGWEELLGHHSLPSPALYFTTSKLSINLEFQKILMPMKFNWNFWRDGGDLKPKYPPWRE